MKRKRRPYDDFVQEYKSGKRKKTQKRTCNGCALTKNAEKYSLGLGAFDYDRETDSWYCELFAMVDIDENIPLEPCFKPRSMTEVAAAFSSPYLRIPPGR